VKKEKDDFLAAQGFAAANCLIRDENDMLQDLLQICNVY